MQKKWDILPLPPQSFYDEHPKLPKIVANLLFHRNIRTQKDIDEFLNPDYTKNIHDPFLFKDIHKTIERIFKAIENNEKIVIHGDYDADGVSASVILVSTLRALGAKHVDIFLPHREIDGYGLNNNTVEKFIEEKINLVITCDCGISNIEEITKAKEHGIDTIVTDHHTVPTVLPPAISIIHPKVVDETYPDKGLAGGAVAFKLVQGLLRKHKENGQKLNNDLTHEAHEKWLLDMVAIATVGDMVPLVGESRTLTKYGLIVLNRTKRLGLQKLLLEARLLDEEGGHKHELTTETIGFQIAPRINAAGRMNHANTAYNLMMTQDGAEATNLAFELNQNNQERQKLTESLVKDAIKQIEPGQMDKPVLFVLGQEWSTGIVGLIAGKLKEKYYKPTIVMAKNGGEITGSGRSIEGFDIIECLQTMPEYFDRFGGHPMACGFTLKNKEVLELFQNKLIEIFYSKATEIDTTPKVSIDAEIDIDHVTWELYNVLQKFEPFGQANEKPKYLARNLTIHQMKPVGQAGKHLRIMVKSNSNKVHKTIGWDLCKTNGNGTNWGDELKPGNKVDLVFEISVNEWNGTRELQLTIVDLRLSS
ncbi:MAG: single-stranded-DNA-specific exonuclease RecJ [Candidatus Magasanikbacteria bacterium]